MAHNNTNLEPSLILNCLLKLRCNDTGFSRFDFRCETLKFHYQSTRNT